MRVASPCPWCGAEVTLDVEAGGEEVWLACAACFGAGTLAEAVRAAERRGYLAALDDVLDALCGHGPRAPLPAKEVQRT